MGVSTRVAAPNGLLFVNDLGGGTIPEPTGGSRIWSTQSCVAVGCKIDCEGETQVTLGKAREVDPGYEPSFDDALETPGRAVIVSIVPGEKVLEATVPTSSTRVRVWVNHPSEPDGIIIGLE